MDEQTIVAICAAGIVMGAGILLIGGSSSSGGKGSRVRELSGKKSIRGSLKERMVAEDKSSRRKQIEESLGKLEARQFEKKRRSKTLQSRLIQADWSMKPQSFLMISIAIFIVVAALCLILRAPLLISVGLSFALGFGLPRFILNTVITRRQKKFTEHFADAMDIIVRGVRTGLPLGDCLKIIAHESPDPLGTEFRKVVEGEGLGIPIEVCLEQLYERIPVTEVNFFATVLNIQKTSGGNLGESLANLSGVLRGRKLLRQKIKALAAEAKVSAIIIGALPLIVMGLVTVVSPDYMDDLYFTPTGQRNLVISAVMMAMGTFVMRKMMNFKF